jgi:hypothetical protein
MNLKKCKAGVGSGLGASSIPRQSKAKLYRTWYFDVGEEKSKVPSLNSGPHICKYTVTTRITKE